MTREEATRAYESLPIINGFHWGRRSWIEHVTEIHNFLVRAAKGEWVENGGMNAMLRVIARGVENAVAIMDQAITICVDENREPRIAPISREVYKKTPTAGRMLGIGTIMRRICIIFSQELSTEPGCLKLASNTERHGAAWRQRREQPIYSARVSGYVSGDNMARCTSLASIMASKPPNRTLTVQKRIWHYHASTRRHHQNIHRQAMNAR